MVRVLVTLLVPLVTAHIAHAGACPPAVALTGDADAVRAVRDQLAARGIVGETPSCPALRAQIERRGAQLVVSMVAAGSRGAPDHGAGPGVARAVGGATTAATVIESWVRGDVAAPLLEIRAVPALDAARPAPVPAATGIQLFAAGETSLASDRTLWQGLELGACVMLGPICAAARVRAGKVIARPDGWRRFNRKNAALYGGVEVPIALGRLRVLPGFSAGYGSMLTHHVGDDGKTSVEISGPRAEAHIAISIPLSAHIAIDLATTAELTQATAMETHGTTEDAAVAFPDEPRALFGFAVGVRYGAL